MPNLRQKKAIARVLEGAGSVSQAMREAGYPEGTAKNPQQLTRSKAWKDLMEEYLPDDVLATKHRVLLDHDEGNVQTKALDMAYKLKGSYAPDKSLNVNVDLTIDDTAVQELATLLDQKAKSAMNAVHERTNQRGNGVAADAVDKEIQDTHRGGSTD